MAEPRISGIEVHTYTYSLDKLGKDYNGFNLVYVPGSTVQQTGHIIRILTDEGIVGEYAGGSAADYALLPSLAQYLIGKHALERERIYADVSARCARSPGSVWRRSISRSGILPASITRHRFIGCLAAIRTGCPVRPAPTMATQAVGWTARRPMVSLRSSVARWAIPRLRSMAGARRQLHRRSPPSMLSARRLAPTWT